MSETLILDREDALMALLPSPIVSDPSTNSDQPTSPSKMTVFEAGRLDHRVSGRINETLRLALAKVDGESDARYAERFEAARRQYMSGFISSALSCPGARALAILDLKAYSDTGTKETHRDMRQQAAYNAAKVAWGRALARAEIETVNKAKATRKPRMAGSTNSAAADETTDSAPITIQSAHVPTFKSMSDVSAYMMAMATHLDAVHSHNAKVFTGDHGMEYRELIALFAMTVKKEHNAITLDSETSQEVEG